MVYYSKTYKFPKSWKLRGETIVTIEKIPFIVAGEFDVISPNICLMHIEDVNQKQLHASSYMIKL